MPSNWSVAPNDRENIEEPIAKPWLAVFDLDGTLIDSSRDLIFSVNEMLVQVGASSLEAETITSFIGNGASSLVERALSAACKPAVLLKPELFEKAYITFLTAYRKHKLDTTKPYPGVLETLFRIRTENPGMLMAILTNKPVRPSREICDALQLSPYFFANYGGDSFATKKPDPIGLRAIITEAEGLLAGSGRPLPLKGVVMIGDAAPDVLVARAVGVRSIGCLYGLSPDQILATQPDFTVSQPEEWMRVLCP